MTNKTEQTYIDKSSWADGTWKNEPDRLFWIDSETNLPCIVLRNPKYGILCGYVGIMKDHPFYGEERIYKENGISSKLQCHGGITYSRESDDDMEFGVSHPNNEDKVWWIGFDCGHFMDKEPHTLFPLLNIRQEYRDIGFVAKEVESLARQLKNMEKANVKEVKKMNEDLFEYVIEKEKVQNIINSFNEATKNENFEDNITAAIIFLAEKHLGVKNYEVPKEICAEDIKQDFLYYYDAARKQSLDKEKETK